MMWVKVLGDRKQRRHLGSTIFFHFGRLSGQLVLTLAAQAITPFSDSIDQALPRDVLLLFRQETCKGTLAFQLVGLGPGIIQINLLVIRALLAFEVSSLQSA